MAAPGTLERHVSTRVMVGLPRPAGAPVVAKTTRQRWLGKALYLCNLWTRNGSWVPNCARVLMRQTVVAKKYHWINAAISAVPGLLIGMASVAQTQNTSEGIEEIIVTAQKREQNLQEVGIAVTAFTGDQMRNLGIASSTDIVAMTPGLNYTTPNADSSVINFFLRGVGLNDFADASENPVATYVDDVYRPASSGLSYQLFDLERVEV